jgi:hypothetical protein
MGFITQLVSHIIVINHERWLNQLAAAEGTCAKATPTSSGTSSEHDLL